MIYNKSLFGVSCLIAFGLLISSCAGLPPPQDAVQRTGQPTRTDREPSRQPQQQDLSLPVRFQQPSYVTKDYTLEKGGGLAPSDLSMKVGADIKTMSGPVALREIMKRLASLKDMSLSWDSDVNQDALVDVHIRAEDDYFQSINNLLWQLDYYHEVRGNTILIKYMKSQTFHLAMPFMVNNFSVAVGGDVLGSSGGQGEGGGNNVKGNVQLNSEISKVPAESVAIDVWRNIQTNLDKILELGTVTPAMLVKTEIAEATGTAPQAPSPPPTQSSAAPRKGYYTIDKPVGLITVTAPPFMLEKIAQYLERLKKELYRQVSIEAKIVEVNLSDGSKKGIDWSKLLDSLPITANVEFGTGGTSGQVYPSEGTKFISKISLNSTSFDILIQALEEQGETRVLSNPRLSVMNGQPALISIGENVAYIDKVESTSDLGVITYSVSTSSVMSGLAMAVVPTIMEGGEIVMQLTPVTSQLQKIESKSFGGAAGTEVGLPTVKLRELNTTVRVKDGEMLVVGGLIDNYDETTQKKVPFLGDLPLVGVVFKSDVKQKTQRELIILLQSKIIS